LINKEYIDKIEKQLSTPVPPPIVPPVNNLLPEPQYRLSDFKSSTIQSLNSMLKINPNLALFRIHPQLKTHIYTPIEQAINESSQTVQRSLKVSTTAAETIVRKDFLLNPDEQQLRTSARNMVAYLSSGLVLITARSALQEQIQTYIKTHFHNALGITQTTEQATIDLIQQTANEIAITNIELCCCLLQRITISRAIQLIDQRLASEIESRQRCRNEGRQLSIGNNLNDDKLPEQIRTHYGPFSSHQLAIYEDFVHFIPGFKPNETGKRDLVTMDESVPSVWDRLVSEIDQRIQIQPNQLFSAAFPRLLESMNALRPTLHNQTITNISQAPIANLLNVILFNYLEYFTLQTPVQQDNENLERFKTIHMSVLKLLIELRLPLSFINEHLTKSWLECVNDVKYNILAVHYLLRNRLLDIRQIDIHLSQLIDSGSSSALHFAVNFLRTCIIEQPTRSDNDIPLTLDSLHRISLIGKQPAEAVRDLLEIIRLNHISLIDSNENKIDKLAILSLSVISNGIKYLSIDDIETVNIVSKAKLILNDWIALTMTQTNRINQQQAFQEFFNKVKIIVSYPIRLTGISARPKLFDDKIPWAKYPRQNPSGPKSATKFLGPNVRAENPSGPMFEPKIPRAQCSSQKSLRPNVLAENPSGLKSAVKSLGLPHHSQSGLFIDLIFFSQMTQQGIFRSEDTIAKFLRMTIQLCVNNVYDVIRQNSSSSQQPQYGRCHQGIDSLCRFLYLLTIHTSNNTNYDARIHLINCILGLLSALCVLDHEEQGDQFHPLAYQRIILNLFQESTNAVTLMTST
jgi:hypothetical protein